MDSYVENVIVEKFGLLSAECFPKIILSIMQAHKDEFIVSLCLIYHNRGKPKREYVFQDILKRFNASMKPYTESMIVKTIHL